MWLWQCCKWRGPRHHALSPLGFRAITQQPGPQYYDELGSEHVDIKQTLFHYLFQHPFTFSENGHWPAAALSPLWCCMSTPPPSSISLSEKYKYRKCDWLLNLVDHILMLYCIYLYWRVFFFPVLNRSMIRDSETPFGTAASLGWSTTCCVWWAAGPSSAAFGIFLPCRERWEVKIQDRKMPLFIPSAPRSWQLWYTFELEVCSEHFWNFTWTFFSLRRVRTQSILPTAWRQP